MRVAGAWLYPLKSGAPWPVGQLVLGPQGLRHDRVAMVLDAAGRMLTARDCPALLTIRARPLGKRLRLSAPGRPPLLAVPVGKAASAALWSETVTVRPAGEEADRWLTAALDRPARLVFTAPAPPRPDPGGLAQGLGDVAVLHLLTEASLAALNARLLVPVLVERFRPNLLIAGAAPFDEDGWDELQVGRTRLRILGPAERCVLPTIGPETLAPDPGGAPLAQLARFRTRDRAIDFGLYASLLDGGPILPGDPVQVIRRRPAHAYSDLPAPAPGARRLLRLVTAAPAGGQSRHLWLQPDDGGPPLAPLPGQFAVLHLPLPGGEVTRCYTVSARDSDRLRLTVRAMGLASRWLNAAPVGQSFWCSAVAGEMVLPETGPLLMLTAGSGITPALAMLAAAAPGRAIRHIHLERRRADVADLPALTARAADDPAYCLTLVETAKTGRALPDLGPLDGATVILCGPPGFCAAAQVVLPAGTRVLSESFSAPDLPASCGPVQTYRVTLDGKPFTARTDQTLLSAAEAAGLTLPASCRAGLCRTCECRLISGETLAPPPPAGLPAGHILPCTTRPAGDPAGVIRLEALER